MNFSSKLIENAVEEFSKLPGIGRKTALRLVLHLIRQEENASELLGTSIQKLRKEIRFCQQCHNVADTDLCNICAARSRKKDTICVVETIRDVIAIETTSQYNGLYHVLGGVISPVDGIGPDDINIKSLINRVQNELTQEVIMALSPTIEGDTTIFYVSKKLQPYPVSVTTISRGVAFGGELEYTDELTLARSIATRLPYENYLLQK